ncbi:MAG: peptidoglycan-binding domain-containing protein [Candidatus Nomurabacteria bacterium]
MISKKIIGLVFVFLIGFGVNYSHAQSACINLTSNLKVGSVDTNTGGDVTQLQNFLYQKGYLKNSPTGYFGSMTKKAISSYQKSVGLSSYGNLGNLTKKSIYNDSCQTASKGSLPVIAKPGDIPTAVEVATTTSNTASSTNSNSSSSVVIFTQNNNEIYQQGSPIKISWTGGKNKVVVGLIDSSYTGGPTGSSIVGWISINEKPNSSLVWDGKLLSPLNGIMNIPVVPNKKYKILAVSEDYNTNYCSWAFDNSCNFYITNPISINSASSTASSTSITSPLITIISPNGGEVYKQGQQITVNWKAIANANANVNIDLAIKTATGIPNTFLMSSSALASDGNKTMTIPLNVPNGSSYVIHLDLFDSVFPNNAYPAVSANPFTIQSNATTSTTPTGDTTHRIAYWWGKVNQHTDSQGNWLTDTDGTSGADLDQLTYCKKFWPNTTSVSSYKTENILTWKRASYFEQSDYSNTVSSYQCLQGATVSALSGNDITITQASGFQGSGNVQLGDVVLSAYTITANKTGTLYSTTQFSSLLSTSDSNPEARISGLYLCADILCNKKLADLSSLNNSTNNIATLGNYSTNFTFSFPQTISAGQSLTVYLKAKILGSLGQNGRTQVCTHIASTPTFSDFNNSSSMNYISNYPNSNYCLTN